MSNDRLEPFNYHNIAFKRCADVVSLERLDRLWFFRHHWFVKIGWFGKCWTDLLAFWGVWNRSRILNFGPDRLFFRFSRALGPTCPKVPFLTLHLIHELYYRPSSYGILILLSYCYLYKVHTVLNRQASAFILDFAVFCVVPMSLMPLMKHPSCF